jgi:adenylate cyclase
MADVFVSYARADRARVAPLVSAIEAQGWSVWWDPDISPGQEFDRQIVAELKVATAVLVVWTPRSVQSRWVRGEARDGAERGILVPVRFDAAELPIDVRTLHTTDLDGWNGESGGPPFEEVLRALGRLVLRRSESESPAAATTPPPSRDAAAVPGRVSICVLPFANMSGDPEQEYFSDGITEDIITDLSKVSALSVTSRNSAFVYKGRHVDVTKLARELKVSYVLEGSVRKAGGRVRISAQLVDAASNDHIWAERYDRDLSDIFALQDEISQAIVAALKLRLLPEEKQAIERRGTDNVEAYNLYLMARQLYIDGHEGDARRAEAIIRLTSRATECDPGYAPAWALLALGQMILRYVRGSQLDDGLAAAERALVLSPGLAEAHAIKARILSEDGHYADALTELDNALRLDPESYEANRSMAFFCFRQRRTYDAVRHYEKAMAVMETDIHSGTMLIACYNALGNAEAGRQAAKLTLVRAQRALARDPNNGAAMSFGASALAELGEASRAKEWMNRAMLIDPDNIKTRYNYACFLSVPLHEIDAALEVLEPLFATISIGLLNHAKVDTDLDPLRDDPRFKAMVAAAEARLSRAI